MEERNAKTEVLVGLFLVVGLLLLGTLILQFSGVRELFKGTYPLTVGFPDGTGIKKDTPIVLSGTKVGKVTAKPKLNDSINGVIVPLAIYQGVQIPTDAKFTIGTAGLLGDSFIQIKTDDQPSKDFIQPNTHIQGAPSSGLKNMQETAEQIAKKVDITLEDLRTSLKKINEGVFSDDSIKNLNESFKHLNSVITRLDEKTLTDQTSAEIKNAVTSFKDAGASFKDVARALEKSVEKLDPVFLKLDDIATKAEKAVDSAESAMKSIDKNAEVAGNAVREISKGDGLLPALMKDSELRNEFRRLITNLREHGVLFYRDNAGKPEAAKENATPRTARPMTGTKR